MLDPTDMERILGQLTPADQILLSGHVERPWQTARRRRAIRAEAIEAAAALLPDARPTIRAKGLARRLKRYAEGEWKRHVPPQQPLDAALHTILRLTGGHALAWLSIHRVLRAGSLSNSPLILTTESCDAAGYAPTQAEPDRRATTPDSRIATVGGGG